MHDVQYAVRTLLRNPGFAATAILTLALGIGGTSAVFTIVNRVVLNPLPFAESDRLVLIWGSKPHEGQPEIPFSQPDFEDLRSQSTSFDALALWAPGRDNVVGGGEPEQTQYAVVTASFFELLGARAQAGRLFRATEDRRGTAPVAVISHGLWQRQFAGAADAIGRTLRLEQQAVQIVGILPPDFRFSTFPDPTDVWLPLGIDPSEGRRFVRGMRSAGVIARLRRDVPLEQARAETDAIAASIAQAHPRFNAGRRFVVVPLHDQVVRGVRVAALVFLGGVAIVLLIACANVASLLLARGSARQRELTVRAALGASRWRLVRHQLVESLVLAAAGGAAGLLLSAWLVELLVQLPYRTDSLYVPYAVPREAISVDGTVLAFTIALSIATAAIFGILPALAGSRAGARDALRAGGRATAGSRQQRARAALVVAEIALALVLLVTAGLTIRGFLRLQQVDPGFSPSGVLTMRVTLSQAKYGAPVAIAQYYQDALARLQALPGVQHAGAVEFLPLSGVDGSTGFYIDGRPQPARADEQRTHHRTVSADYFAAMQIPVAQGRTFTGADNGDAPRVAIVNESMARRFWPGESPIGKRIALDFEAMRYFRDRPPVFDLPLGMREIVGVVGDIRHDSLTSEPEPEMYTPLPQRAVPGMTIVVRTAGDPTILAAAAREAVRSIDPTQPAPRVETLSNLVAASIAQPRANFVLLSAFAAVALALAVVGVYGVLAYMVSLRTAELGIRVALGGRPRDLRNLVLGEYARLAAAGILLGVPLAIALTAALRRSFFVDTQGLDLATIGIAATLLAAVAFAASLIPARRAARVDPIGALRAE